MARPGSWCGVRRHSRSAAADARGVQGSVRVKVTVFRGSQQLHESHYFVDERSLFSELKQAISENVRATWRGRGVALRGVALVAHARARGRCDARSAVSRLSRF